jgi:hypothetical protein
LREREIGVGKGRNGGPGARTEAGTSERETTRAARGRVKRAGVACSGLLSQGSINFIPDFTRLCLVVVA